MKVLGQQRVGIWDIGHIRIQMVNRKISVIKAKPNDEAYIVTAPPEDWLGPTVVFGKYSFKRCQEILTDIALCYNAGDSVYIMPEE